jgi:cell division inhibitor SepF
MGILDNLKRIARPYDDETFEDYEEKPKPAAAASSSWIEGEDLNVPEKRTGNKVVNIHATARLQVVLVMPEQYEAAREIADHLRDKRTVVLNLENTNKEISRRILDFVSGVAYAQDGKIKKVAVSTFIVTPYNVDILGDLIDELENNGVYF